MRYIDINSALVSAQNRERFYVHNCGEVGQPKDRGILLKDVLISGYDLTSNEKSYALTASYNGAIPSNTIERKQRNMAVEPIECKTVQQVLPKLVDKYGYVPKMFNPYNTQEITDKSPTLSTGSMVTSSCATIVTEPIQVGAMPTADGQVSQSQGSRIYNINGKSVTLKANGGGGGAKTGLYAVPTMKIKEATQKGYAEIIAGRCVDLTQPNSKTRRGRSMSNKSNCLTTSNEFYEYCGTIKRPIYEVRNGKITIKGKEYPIKLVGGFYIIRKLTVAECRRLQTVPDWYKMPCSDTQNYKMLGNGWTIEVIKHILSYIPNIKTEPIEVLSMYDGMSCARIALKELGANVVRYYATEIDKYAIQTTQANFPDTIQLGNAFQVREENWKI